MNSPVRTFRMHRIGKRARAISAGLVAVLSLSASLVLSACADSTEASDTAGVDGGAALPPDDHDATAPTTDADARAAEDAGNDAAPRMCSDENFCHTALPVNQTLQAVWADGDGAAWAVTLEGSILRWDGTTWVVRETGLGELRAIWGSGPTEIWAVGAKGIYGGHGDSSANVAFSPSLRADDGETLFTGVWGTSGNDVWAVGQRTDFSDVPGLVYHFTGPSADPETPSWSRDPLSDAEWTTYDRVWGTPGGDVWMSASVSDSWPTLQRILRRSPTADTFEEIPLPGFPDPMFPTFPDGVPSELYGAAAVSDNEMWLAIRTDSYNQGYYHGISANGGATFDWTIVPYDRIDDLAYTAFAGSSSGVWAVGKYGRLETWNGRVFEQASIATNGLPVVDPLYGIWTAPTGELWAVGKNIALHRAKK